MSGPIVRTGTTPGFWENYDRVFGGKTKASATKAPAATKKKAATAKPAAVKKQQASGQGWKLSKEDQTAVDGQAMKKAAEFWKKAGYRVVDVHLNHPYDLEVTLGVELRPHSEGRFLLSRCPTDLNQRENWNQLSDWLAEAAHKYEIELLATFGTSRDSQLAAERDDMDQQDVSSGSVPQFPA